MSSTQSNPASITPQYLLQQLLEVLPIGITVTDLQSNILFRNNIFTQWIPNLIMENRLWLVQLLPFLQPEQRELFTSITIDDIISNFFGKEIRLEAENENSRLGFALSYHPLLDDKNKVIGLIELCRNITDYMELDKSLQHARRFETVGRLASGIAHDFNNILQVINGHSEILLETHKDNDKLARSLEIVLSSGQRASNLTRQLLLFSRRQQGEFKQVNLGELLSNMQKIINRMLGEDIQISTSYDDAGTFLEGDISQLEQIIMNLSINARDAMPEGGKISINTGLCEFGAKDKEILPYLREGKYVYLFFRDTGCGIPAPALEHIFEPFFTTKEAGRGTGLGLATVYSIIKQHQGFINVESIPGQGSTFKLYFPVCESTQCNSDECKTYAHGSGCNQKVLILEDDNNVRELASAVLTRSGYCVKTASDIKQAQAMVQREAFDLLFIDIVLPDGDGVSFLESLSGDNANAAYILSSGYPEDKPQIKKTISKGYTFLHKPFTINLLLEACSEALKKIQT